MCMRINSPKVICKSADLEFFFISENTHINYVAQLGMSRRVYFHELEVGQRYRTLERDKEEIVQVDAIDEYTVKYTVLARRNGNQWPNVEMVQEYDFESGVNGDHVFYALVAESPRIENTGRRPILTRRYRNNMGVGPAITVYSRRRGRRRPLTRRRGRGLTYLPGSR